jgi:alkanesulfonate monooxygenase SsuD/methylene tetrahydromethanopterin reductase-like flavin-dependent oxidoreductase (luciferase family)
MEFGIFDHLDRNELPLRDFYEQRLALAELYDRLGFYCYHIAEHHSTPLGLAPSPSVFLSAVAQRTRRLRFGPLVYALPLHHPLRLVEEICMLDQLSGGRLQVGVGRGASPIETDYFGVDPDKRQAMYAEALAIVLAGLTQPVLNFKGEFYAFDGTPMELCPLQRPHPPLWFGITSPESAQRAGREGHNFVALAPVEQARQLVERYRAGWNETRAAQPVTAKLGLCRFVIVAERDADALAIARRTYPRWHSNFYYLFNLHGQSPNIARPPDFDQIKDGGRGIAGSPARVVEMLRAQLTESGANYFVAQFAFGDQTFAEVQRTVELFAREVMPALLAGY